MENGNHVTDYGTKNSELVLRAQQGDADAFAALFNEHKTKVYSTCLRMTANHAEAEDLTQDIFLHVFRKLASFRGESAFSTWLHRVTINTVLMRFRRNKMRQIPLEARSHPNGAREPEYGRGDGRLNGAVDRITLRRALGELPGGYRKIFLLHEVDGYQHHDIADLLGCSVGTSKSQLHKAKLRLRELLGARRRAAAASKLAARIAGVLRFPQVPIREGDWDDSGEAA